MLMLDFILIPDISAMEQDIKKLYISSNSTQHLEPQFTKDREIDFKLRQVCRNNFGT